MKVGEKFNVSLYDLARFHIGQILTVTLADQPDPIRARVVSVTEEAAELEIVPENTKQ